MDKSDWIYLGDPNLAYAPAALERLRSSRREEGFPPFLRVSDYRFPISAFPPLLPSVSPSIQTGSTTCSIDWRLSSRLPHPIKSRRMIKDSRVMFWI